MKLVINSNINYKKPLRMLLESLQDSGFKDFEDVVLVISQSPQQKGPATRNVGEILQIPAWQKTHDLNVTTIEMQMNNFDYAGYHALNLYKNHPLVADYDYFYVLDTSTFEPRFPEKYKKFKSVGPAIITCEPPHANTCVIGREVVDNYGDNFSIELTKQEAIRLEFGLEVAKKSRRIKSINEFGFSVKTKNRQRMELRDIYGTGYPRTRVHYEDFGINKWILFDMNGDMTGKVRMN